MVTTELGALLGRLSPTRTEVLDLFSALSRVSPPILQVLVDGLDEEVVQRLSKWGQAFIEDLNTVKYASPEEADDIAQLTFDPDFFATMRRVKYIGDKLRASDLQRANNEMTKAVKAENWKKALWTAISVARFAGV